MEIRNGTFIVTGGGSGLGAAVSAALVEAGGNVVVADVNRAAGEKVAAGLGGRARFAPTDVTSEESVKAAVALAADAFGPLRGAINCAGVAVAEKLLGRDGPHSLASFAFCINVNLVGTFNVVRLAAEAIAAAEPLPSGERGVVVNTASVAAFEGQLGQTAYSASKGGIVAMTLPMARELARFGIRVVTVAPGIFDTPMLAGLSEPVRQSLGQMVPFPARLGRPQEFAALVRHIVENEMLNGEVIRLDGAVRLAPK